MKTIQIALNTFKENIRDKVLYNLLFFALIIIAVSTILGQVAIGHETKIIVDMGLSAVSIFGALIAIFIGTGLVYKELDKRTIYNLISKPVRRYEFILGKYLGFLFTLLINISLMAVGVYLALVCFEKSVRLEHFYLLAAVELIYLQLMMVTAIALMFSTFSTPVLSAVFTFSLWTIGHFSQDMKLFSALVRIKFLGKLCLGFYYLLPNFSNFALVDNETIIRAAGHFHPPNLTLVLLSTIYGLLYIAVILSATILIFERKDFK